MQTARTNPTGITLLAKDLFGVAILDSLDNKS